MKKITEREKQFIQSNILTILERITNAGLLKEIFPQFEWRHEYSGDDCIVMYYKGPKHQYMMLIPTDYPIPFTMIDNIINKWRLNPKNIHAYDTSTQSHAYDSCEAIQIPALPKPPKPRCIKGGFI